jgi:DNA-directed RNA polymerase specialized sigma24 family protein
LRRRWSQLYGVDLFQPLPEARALNPKLVAVLRSLRPGDCEALLLVACEDLSPSIAAKSLGISQTAFRVRLHRAGRRFRRALAAMRISASTCTIWMRLATRPKGGPLRPHQGRGPAIAGPLLVRLSR